MKDLKNYIEEKLKINKDFIGFSYDINEISVQEAIDYIQITWINKGVDIDIRKKSQGKNDNYTFTLGSSKKVTFLILEKSKEFDNHNVILFNFKNLQIAPVSFTKEKAFQMEGVYFKKLGFVPAWLLCKFIIDRCIAAII